MSDDDWFDQIRDEMEAELAAYVPPVDWDQESYCVVDGCTSPATHEDPTGVVNDGDLVVEMKCCAHARDRKAGS